MDKKTIADPRTHFGSPKAATRDFKLQRLTGAANIALLLFFIWFVVSLAGADRAGMVATVSNPIVAIILILLMVNVTVHMRIGIQEVIEDYVHDARLKQMALLANTVFAIAVAAVAVISILVLAFGAR
jgi:succinate dehydrogenase / fumarate reductase membrane anchor subunit